MDILARIQSWFIKASIGVKIGTIAASVVAVGAIVTVPIIIVNSGSSSNQTAETGSKTTSTSKNPQNNSSSNTKDHTDSTEKDQDNANTGDTSSENTAQSGNKTSNVGSGNTSSNNGQQNQSNNNNSTNASKPSNNSNSTSKPNTSTAPSTPTTNPSTNTKYDCNYLNQYVANNSGRVPAGYDRDEYMRTCLSEEEYNNRKFWETHQAFYGDDKYTDIEVAAMVLWTNQHCTYSNGQQSCNAHQPWLLPDNVTYFDNIAAQYCEFRGVQEAAGEPYDCSNAPEWVRNLETQTRDYAAKQNGGIYYTQAHFSVPLQPTANGYIIYTTIPTVPTSIYPTNCTRQTVYGQNNVLVCPFTGGY